jgi:transposase-like protein
MEILHGTLASRLRPNHATAELQRQRRLTRSEVDNLVDLYATGINVRQLAAAFGINRDTALRHLQRRDVPSRASIRKLTDDLLAAAARRYLAGEPMTKLCGDLGINPTTLRRELTKTGIQLRRPGRPSARQDK